MYQSSANDNYNKHLTGRCACLSHISIPGIVSISNVNHHSFWYILSSNRSCLISFHLEICHDRPVAANWWLLLTELPAMKKWKIPPNFGRIRPISHWNHVDNLGHLGVLLFLLSPTSFFSISLHFLGIFFVRRQLCSPELIGISATGKCRAPLSALILLKEEKFLPIFFSAVWKLVQTSTWHYERIVQ